MLNIENLAQLTKGTRYKILVEPAWETILYSDFGKFCDLSNELSNELLFKLLEKLNGKPAYSSVSFELRKEFVESLLSIRTISRIKKATRGEE